MFKMKVTDVYDGLNDDENYAVSLNLNNENFGLTHYRLNFVHAMISSNFIDFHTITI